MGSRPWLHHFATSWLGRGFLVCNPTSLRPDGENGAPKNGDRPALRAPKSFIFQESKTGKKNCRITQLQSQSVRCCLVSGTLPLATSLLATSFLATSLLEAASVFE